MKKLLLLAAALPMLIALKDSAKAPEPAPIDPIAALQKRIMAGTTKLAYEPKRGYLESLLKELQIDPSTQTLVFSKTSLQSSYVSSDTPRALYFNSEVYVAWIPDAPLIEIMAIHPVKGVIFYTLPNTALGAKTFTNETQNCFNCHGGRSETQAPNLIVRSSFTAPSGYPRVTARSVNVTPDMPLRQRWGGWYVSGTHGAQRHMGNAFSEGTDDKHSINVENGANITNLSKLFDTKPYLTPHSDIAALMYAEHQMEVQNFLTPAVLWMRKLNPITAEDLSEMCDPVVDALLCVGEAKLTSPVRGTSDFASKLRESYPKDAQGRSLGDLDLQTRLLKYPCSPMIYSKSFDALPPVAKTYIWKRIAQTLSGKAKSPEFAATLEILRATRPDFAASTP